MYAMTGGYVCMYVRTDSDWTWTSGLVIEWWTALKCGCLSVGVSGLYSTIATLQHKYLLNVSIMMSSRTHLYIHEPGIEMRSVTDLSDVSSRHPRTLLGFWWDSKQIRRLVFVGKSTQKKVVWSPSEDLRHALHRFSRWEVESLSTYDRQTEYRQLTVGTYKLKFGKETWRCFGKPGDRTCRLKPESCQVPS